jgi:hypothetical protein
MLFTGVRLFCRTPAFRSQRDASKLTNGFSFNQLLEWKRPDDGIDAPCKHQRANGARESKKKKVKTRTSHKNVACLLSFSEIHATRFATLN